jgi:hypothetical protein
METLNKFTAYNDVYQKPLERQTILNNYSTETIERVWEAFSKSIAINFQMGKGTHVHKFGSFTFTNPEVNLEGTTNQFNRDNKARKPVFLVSNDFVERLKSGIYGSNGIIYYTQKLNNNISHVKVNFTQIALNAGINKDDCVTIFDHYIKAIGDSIVNVFIN